MLNDHFEPIQWWVVFDSFAKQAQAVKMGPYTTVRPAALSMGLSRLPATSERGMGMAQRWLRWPQ